MEQIRADFIFTGEVLGQRPFSQTKPSLRSVEKESGYPDRILRPLSALRLKETLPEREGLVDRTRLLDISGRSRKRQMTLAERYELYNYPAPAGGCLLTDPRYAARLQELLRHVREASRQDLELLKWGRHFRLPGGGKAVVGRNQRDNEAIQALRAAGNILLQVDQYPGPLVLGCRAESDEDLAAAADLAAAYSDAPSGMPVTVTAFKGGPDRIFHLTTPGKDRFKPWLI